jgi:site-specific DNA recombinase
MLKNPAYAGEAAFGKTRSGPLRPKLRAQRGRPLQPRRAYSHYDVPSEEWISIPVPAIVNPELFRAVQEQLQENKRHARGRHRGTKYLLQGLLVCQSCGYAYYGKAISHSARKGNPREYAYYRCLGTDAYRFGGERVCSNKQVRTDLLDLAVWQEVRKLLEHPKRLAEEYRRRLRPHSEARRDDLTMVEAQLVKLRRGLARLIDGYAEGLIQKEEFEPRIARMRSRIPKLEEQAQQLADETSVQAELRLVIGRLEDFCEKMKDGLDEADWSSRRDIIRVLVKHVEVEQERVNVVFRVDQAPFDESPERGVLQRRRRGDLPATRQRLPQRVRQVGRSKVEQPRPKRTPMKETARHRQLHGGPLRGRFRGCL